MAAETSQFYNNYINSIKNKAKSEVKKAVSKTYQDLFVEVEVDVKDIFEEAVDKFYDDYSPTVYDRNDSLYNLLQTERDVSGNSLSLWFEPEKMTTFRDGYDGDDGLYDQVFRKGWHGGAEKESSGVPFWRKPPPYYTYWGRPAKIANTAPLKDIQDSVQEYQSGKMINKFSQIWERNKRNIKIDI